MEAEQFAPGRLHLLTGHDYTRCFVNHATHVATRPLTIHAAGQQLLRIHIWRGPNTQPGWAFSQERSVHHGQVPGGPPGGRRGSFFSAKHPLNPIPFNERSGIEALAGGEPPKGSGPALFEKVLPKPLDSGAGRRENGNQAAGLTLRF